MAAFGQLTYDFFAFEGVIPLLWTRPWEAKVPTSLPAVKAVNPEATPAPIPPALSITKILEEQGYQGCDFLTQPRGISKVLFVCGKKVNNELKPSFFHFDNTSVLKTNGAAKVESNHIVGITYNSSSSINMKFEKGPRSVQLKNSPYWLNKWKGRGEVNPDNDCSLDKAGGSTYTLKFDDTSGNKVEIQRGINIWSFI